MNSCRQLARSRRHAPDAPALTLTGEVNKPGPVELFPHMTVLQALASAGGLTQYAKEKKIYILRKKAGGEERLKFNYKRAARGLPAGNITLKPEDTIFVP